MCRLGLKPPALLEITGCLGPQRAEGAVEGGEIGEAAVIGDVDYLIRLAVANMTAYDDFYRRLIALVPMKNVTSRFAMERVKYTTAYPLPSD